MATDGMQCLGQQPSADALAAAPQVPQQQPGTPPDAGGGDPMVKRDSAFSGNISNSVPLSNGVVQRSSLSHSSFGEKVRSGSKEVDDLMLDIVSFYGCEELLRGSHLSVIMRNQARIFTSSAGSAATYALSVPTKMLDAFISHNWVVPRWQKWLCLSLHFNMRIAMALTFVVVSPLGVVAAHGWVPVVQPAWAAYPRSYIFRLIQIPIFLFIMCFYRDIVRCFPTWSPIVFLDKTCIHQVDKDVQRKGIEKLGAFLCYSKTMVICYTDVYLQKLWTVYEVASFMTVQSVDKMRVIPVLFPIVFMGSLSLLWAAGTIGLWPELEAGFYYTMHVFIMLMCYGIMVVFRRWGRSKLKIYQTVSSFTARNCVCFCEDDRPLVYANIAALMRQTQGIGKHATEDEALACFDQLVRDNLADVLISSVGKYSMRYEQAATVGCTFTTPVLDALVGLSYGMPWRELCSYALWYAVITFFIVPFAFMGFFTWANLFMGIQGWLEYVYLVPGLFVVFVPITITRLVLDQMEQWANKSDVGLLVFVLGFVCSALLARAEMNGTLCANGCGYRAGRTKDAPQAKAKDAPSAEAHQNDKPMRPSDTSSSTDSSITRIKVVTI